MNVTVHTDRSLISASTSSTRHVLATIVAPRVRRAEARAPVNVAFVLDRSGSMGGTKFDLARQAVDHALRLLRDDDRFSMVVYDTEIDVIAESTLATSQACRQARTRLQTVHPRRSTDLCGGWLAGCEQVARYITGNGVGRCLLLTDGLANHGVTDQEAIVTHVRELRPRGVATSTFGVGADFDERLLEQMADAGAGNFYFIERPVQIPDFLTSELGEALEIAASGVRLTITTPPGVQAEILNEFASVRETDGLRVELPDLVSGQELSVVARLGFPTGEEGSHIRARFTVRSAMATMPPQTAEQTWSFASDAACSAEVRNQVVDDAVGAIYAARAQAEAVELNRRGDCAGAERVLMAMAREIRVYAGRSAALRDATAKLESAAEAASEPMSPMDLKAMHWGSVSALRSRDPEGKVRKRPE